MAYVSQELKAALSPAIKSVLKKYGMKGSISVRHHSTLVLTLKSGKLDIISNWFEELLQNHCHHRNGILVTNNTYEVPVKPDSIQVNESWIDSNYTGKVKAFLLELKSAMMKGNHDNSDIQSDYFDVGWYISINVGSYDKPYIVE